MEWKPYYDAELRRPETREKIAKWLRAADPSILPYSGPDRPTVLSFPHTAIDDSGPILARVAAHLYRSKTRRVIALGVMHGSLVPTFQVAMEESASPADRAAAFAHVAGGFVAGPMPLQTPFGALPVEWASGDLSDVVRTDARGLLHREFSLDTFAAVLRLGADVWDVQPLALVPVYVGMTRHPVSGSFEVAAELAAWISARWKEDTAVVATGDVVHYGTVYGSEGGCDSPKTSARFRQTLERLFRLAFAEHDLENAYQLSLRELKSDQREILPVLAYLLGEGASARLVTYEWSDYAPIFHAAPPCRVASALIAYVKGV